MQLKNERMEEKNHERERNNLATFSILRNEFDRACLSVCGSHRVCTKFEKTAVVIFC